MNKYELVLLISGKVEKLISGFKGKVGKVDDWGKIDLRYKIKKSENGIFLLLNIELDSDQVKKLHDKLQTDEEILRFLLVKVD